MNVATRRRATVATTGVGRWIVQGLVWNSDYQDAVDEHGGANGVIDTNAETEAVPADGNDGGATTFEARRFVCPVIKNNKG